jgi:hypothetical protein
MIKYMQYISSIYLFHLATVVTLDLQACIMDYLDFLISSLQLAASEVPVRTWGHPTAEGEVGDSASVLGS